MDGISKMEFDEDGEVMLTTTMVSQIVGIATTAAHSRHTWVVRTEFESQLPYKGGRQGTNGVVVTWVVAIELSRPAGGSIPSQCTL